ncbi:hypothetical protein [Candidatus Avelusimicrobium fimicolum]|uniref:hypothetical protein n=1 Tax=Candidatus Avelusimicrobium fimicolum TaxID=3416216 RepID=UPI003D112E3F
MGTATVISLVALGISVIVNVLSVGKFVGRIDGLERLIDFRLRNLEAKQDKYNHLQERIAVLERDNKTAFHLIEQMEQHNG